MKIEYQIKLTDLHAVWQRQQPSGKWVLELGEYKERILEVSHCQSTDPISQHSDGWSEGFPVHCQQGQCTCRSKGLHTCRCLHYFSVTFQLLLICKCFAFYWLPKNRNKKFHTDHYIRHHNSSPLVHNSVTLPVNKIAQLGASCQDERTYLFDDLVNEKQLTNHGRQLHAN